MIIKKSPAEIEAMREAGRISAKVLRLVGAAVEPGISTKELDAMAERLFKAEGAKPGFKGYGGFPGSICASINNEIVPRGHEVRRNLVKRISVGAGIDLLEPGRTITDFPNVKIHFNEKKDGKLLGLTILDYSNPNTVAKISVATAEVSQVGRDLVLRMRNISGEPTDADDSRRMSADVWEYRLKDALKDDKYKRREKDFTLLPRMTEDGTVKSEIFHAMSSAKQEVKVVSAMEKSEKSRFLRRQARRRLSDVRTEFMKRLVSAFASICFVLVGVPLGIRAQRRESTIGMAIALVVALTYNLLELLMTSLSKNYALHPEILIWLPVALCVALAARLIPKNL